MRQLSPGSADRSELMLCVATIGMHFGCRERLKNFSSPVGSLSPTVAKCWYSSQRNRTWRKCFSGFASICGHAIQHGALKIEFHHYPDGFGEPRVHADGKIERADFACLDQPGERRKRLSVPVSRVLLRIVALRVSGRRRASLWGCRRTGRERRKCLRRLRCAASARCVASPP